MTTSYPLSLRLKELGVSQQGEYYWVEEWGKEVCVHKSQTQGGTINEILCRALTLGEVVRMLGMNWNMEMKKDGTYDFMKRGELSYGNPSIYTNNQSPEESAGELLAEIKEQEKQKA